MHILFVAVSFPSPESPYRSPFIREQVRLLCERPEVERITVLSPMAYAPSWIGARWRMAKNASVPERYELVKGRCEVLFPRYVKLPGNGLLRWTVVQWRRIIDRIVTGFGTTRPVSLIHANSGSVSGWASIIVARRHQIPCVVTYQGSEVHQTFARRMKGWRLCRDSYRHADLNLFVSRSLEETLRAHAEPAGRSEVLLRGVDLTRYFPAEKAADEPRVIFVGNVQAAKGVFDLLTAWVRVRQACPDAVLTVVGPDRTGGLLEREVRAKGIEASVVRAGPLPATEVANLIRRSRLLCLPSYGEGTPNCVTEALACGVPVVATRVGGIPDVVQDGITGLLVEPGDSDGLADSLADLLQDPGRCAEMGRSGNRFAREHLDARKTIERLVGLYGELLARPSSATRTANASCAAGIGTTS